MGTKNELLKKIDNKNAVIGIVGMGYVGLPLAMRFSEVGFKVVGFDVDSEKIEKLNSGHSYIVDIKSERVSDVVGKKLFRATSEFRDIKDTDAAIICVPTPLTESKEPDLSYVLSTAKEISKYLRSGHVISLESTTYPGTTREEVLPILARQGLKVGEDFFLCFSPEREDPGNKTFKLEAIPKVVGGLTKTCTEVGSKLYGNIVKEVFEVSTPEVAETEKLLENIFRSVNIALVNELKVLTDRMGIDVWEVIEAASTKPFGFMPFYPGPGLGGHCIPIDPFYLSWKAKQYDFHTRFIELAGEINTSMPYYVVNKIIKAVNDKGKSIKCAKIFLLGIAYKPDIGDLRESPALKIIELLKENGAFVEYNDPFCSKIPETRKYDFDMSSKELNSENLKKADCVVITTNHSQYDYDLVTKESKLIVDARNAVDMKRYSSSIAKVVKA